jgi:hypothetical protein
LEDDVLSDPWDGIDPVFGDVPELETDGEPGASYAELPELAEQSRSYTSWQRGLKDHVYRNCPLVLHTCKALKEVSKPGEDLGTFKIRLGQLARERRDLEVEKLRTKFAPKIQRMEAQIQRAQQKVETETSQMKHQATQSAISFGTSILGALLGRKTRGIGGATSAARSASRAAKERGDVQRAKESLESLLPQKDELTAEYEAAVEQLKSDWDVAFLEIDETTIRPRKSDMAVSPVPLVWTPWAIDDRGRAEPLFD